jgi:hypothetical protein
MPPKFTLKPGVSVARPGNLLVFLDERHDRYLALTPLQADLFRQLAAAEAADEPAPQAQAFADRLIRLGLIGETPLGPPLLPPQDNFPPTAPRTDLAPGARRAPPGEYARFAACLVRCWYLHRFTSLSRTLLRARRWKARAGNTPDAKETALALSQAFHAIAPLFISTKDACRFRSLLLFNFLLSRQAAADWVFGVRAAPFAAHCWVEHSGVVLNDCAENTAQYSEILRI